MTAYRGRQINALNRITTLTRITALNRDTALDRITALDRVNLLNRDTDLNRIAALKQITSQNRITALHRRGTGPTIPFMDRANDHRFDFALQRLSPAHGSGGGKLVVRITYHRTPMGGASSFLGQRLHSAHLVFFWAKPDNYGKAAPRLVQRYCPRNCCSFIFHGMGTSTPARNKNTTK